MLFSVYYIYINYMNDLEKHSFCLFQTQEFLDVDAETRFDFALNFIGSFKLKYLGFLTHYFISAIEGIRRVWRVYAHKTSSDDPKDCCAFFESNCLVWVYLINYVRSIYFQRDPKDVWQHAGMLSDIEHCC